MSQWTADQIPDQTGKIIIITGANVGLGFASAQVLAGKGAQVILACRNQKKGAEARQRILQRVPKATVEVMRLDLASLESVRQFAETFGRKYQQLDVLMNNAGIMGVPYENTIDGFEMQFGTNHLGHFALTGLLLDTLLKTPRSRVVNVSSDAYTWVRGINFEDLHGQKHYDRWAAYGQSKLANILFMSELQRRLASANQSTISVAVHPGLVATELFKAGSLMGNVGRKLLPIFAPGAVSGTKSQLYAATMPDVKGGEFFAPRWGVFGTPVRGTLQPHALDKQAAEQLWAVSEQLTGIRFTALVAPQV